MVRHCYKGRHGNTLQVIPPMRIDLLVSTCRRDKLVLTSPVGRGEVACPKRVSRLKAPEVDRAYLCGD